jgi:hypothetical protein
VDLPPLDLLRVGWTWTISCTAVAARDRVASVVSWEISVLAGWAAC